ncbi:hypothetical protein E2C01_036305 [Portunus trituberculatus]|uniref:Uncharacterized protein n=1 Tax=Portunus trituberculatus TaxID=210409 RepID=A0A5B7FC40_PORTR|nr:hypothetical protein [Portunus trituberculatus]
MRSYSTCDLGKECGIPAGNGWREMLERVTRTRQTLQCLEEHFGKATRHKISENLNQLNVKTKYRTIIKRIEKAKKSRRRKRKKTRH